MHSLLHQNVKSNLFIHQFSCSNLAEIPTRLKMILLETCFFRKNRKLYDDDLFFFSAAKASRNSQKNRKAIINKIEISDDEDDTHPNIHTPSLFKVAFSSLISINWNGWNGLRKKKQISESKKRGASARWYEEKRDDRRRSWETSRSKKRIEASPGGVDPQEVFESLPEAWQKCFETQDIPMLQVRAFVWDESLTSTLESGLGDRSKSRVRAARQMHKERSLGSRARRKRRWIACQCSRCRKH